MTNTTDLQYLGLLEKILNEGEYRNDRTGVGTYTIFGSMNKYDLSEGFPLLTTKKLYTKGIITELLWFCEGNTGLKSLLEKDNHIWTEWPLRNYLQETRGLSEASRIISNADELKDEKAAFEKKILENPEFEQKWGDLGPIYGKQWRDFGGVDQLEQVIEQIKINPDSRRHIVSAWNPPEIPQMEKSGLPPCHALFQFHVLNGKLSCQLYQRSADIFLGVPFNIGSYALLTHMVAKLTGYEPGYFIHTTGDTHLYSNHVEQARRQLTREPKTLPTLTIEDRGQKDIGDFRYEDFKIEGYKSHSAIKAPIAV